MDTKSYLRITTCNEDTTAVEVRRTEFSFMTDWKTSNNNKDISFDLIKYLDNEEEVQARRLYAKFDKFIYRIPVSVLKEPTCHFDMREDNITITLTIISRIMVTPFKLSEQNNKWTIWAKIENNKIRLFTADDDNLYSEAMALHYKLLQNYLFVRKPEIYHRQLISPLHYHSYQVYGLNISGIQLVYPVEISGINSVQEVRNITELQSAEHVYCDIFKEGEYSQEIINYNPVWWSKAVLMKAEQCFIGVYKEAEDEDEDENRISDIIKFNIDKYYDKTQYENLWSPEAAWNFLHTFLLFIKEAINNIQSEFRSDCIWKLQSYVNNEDYITCEPLIRTIVGNNITYKPLPHTALRL